MFLIVENWDPRIHLSIDVLGFYSIAFLSSLLVWQRHKHQGGCIFMIIQDITYPVLAFRFQSQSLAQSIYLSDWYLLNSKQRMKLLMISRQAQKGLCISFHGQVSMSIETFGWVSILKIEKTFDDGIKLFFPAHQKIICGFQFVASERLRSISKQIFEFALKM